jgi:hypothetical protein
MPGRLVPPPTRNKRPDAPASLPAEIARERRALPKGVIVFLPADRGVREVALPESGDSSALLLLLFIFSFSIKPHKICSFQYGIQYNKTNQRRQVNFFAPISTIARFVISTFMLYFFVFQVVSIFIMV